MAVLHGWPLFSPEQFLTAPAGIAVVLTRSLKNG